MKKAKTDLFLSSIKSRAMRAYCNELHEFWSSFVFPSEMRFRIRILFSVRVHNFDAKHAQREDVSNVRKVKQFLCVGGFLINEKQNKKEKRKKN